jgi:hypothetical protein
VPGSGAWFLFSAEIATYPGQVSWFRSGNVLPVPSLLLPQLDGRVDVWRLIFVYSGGTAPGLHRSFLFSPCGHLGSDTVVPRRRLLSRSCSSEPACARSDRVRSTSRTGPQACPKAATASPRTQSGISKASSREGPAVLHRSLAESSKA